MSDPYNSKPFGHYGCAPTQLRDHRLEQAVIRLLVDTGTHNANEAQSLLIEFPLSRLDFSHPAHADVFAAVSELVRSGLAPTLGEIERRMGTSLAIEKTGMGFLARILGGTDNLAPGFYAEAVQRLHQLTERRLSSAKLSGDIETRLLNAGFESLGEQPQPQALEECLEKLKREFEGCSTVRLQVGRSAAIARLKSLKVSNPTKLVDAALKTTSSRENGDEGQGTPLDLEELLPWQSPVDGAEILNELVEVLGSHVVFSTPAHVHAVALWITFTYFIEGVAVAPILAILSPERRCGKTTLMAILSATVRRALAAANISPAALFRTIEMAGPTLLVDEADAFLKDNEPLRGILNAGSNRETAYVVRTVGDSHEPRKFCVFGAKAIAAIGKLPSTIMDRSILVHMRRKKKTEQAARVPRNFQQGMESLRRKLCRFAQDNMEVVGDANPGIPNSLNDRAADCWRALIAIADVAGGDWPHLARIAANEISGDSDDDIEGPAVWVLSDIRELFRDRQAVGISTSEILEYLRRLEERPWNTWKNGMALNAQGLRSLLKPFSIKASKLDCGKVRGFERKSFEDAWSRYLPEDSLEQSLSWNGVSKPPHPPTPVRHSTYRDFESAGDSSPVADIEVPFVEEKSMVGGYGTLKRAFADEAENQTSQTSIGRSSRDLSTEELKLWEQADD